MKVIVLVFGFWESYKVEVFSGIGRLNCNVQYVLFVILVRGKVNQGVEEKEFLVLLYKVLEGVVMFYMFLKMIVDIFVFILQLGGGDLLVVILCVLMVLVDVGIVMYDLVFVVFIGYVGKEVFLDMILEEEKCSDGEMMVMFMVFWNEIIQLKIIGQWFDVMMREVLSVFLDVCVKLVNVMRECLKEELVGVDEDE